MSKSTILPLLSLALCTFSAATSELMLLGLLPGVSASLDVSIPQAGLLVTGYALGVVIAAPVVAIITNGLPRRPMILGLMAIVTVGNAICAVAPNYAILMAARVLTAIAHAAVFGSAAVMAADIAPPERRARAVALALSGAPIATVVGVALGAAIGDAFGWRSAFWTVATLSVAAIVAILVFLPADLPIHRARLRREMRDLWNRQVGFAFVITGLAWASLFAVFTFIAPILETGLGASDDTIVAILFIFGVGMVIGNFVGGRLADWRLLPSIVGLIAAMAVMLAVVSVSMAHPYIAIVALVFWGLLVFSLGPAVQYWVVKAAGGATHLLSTLNQGSFQVGSAAGAWIASSALYFGISYRHLPWVAEALILAALVVAALAVSGEYAHRHRVFARAGRPAGRTGR